jgi:hypothetical protein
VALKFMTKIKGFKTYNISGLNKHPLSVMGDTHTVFEIYLEFTGCFCVYNKRFYFSRLFVNDVNGVFPKGKN